MLIVASWFLLCDRPIQSSADCNDFEQKCEKTSKRRSWIFRDCDRFRKIAFVNSDETFFKNHKNFILEIFTYRVCFHINFLTRKSLSKISASSPASKSSVRSGLIKYGICSKIRTRSMFWSVLLSQAHTSLRGLAKALWSFAFQSKAFKRESPLRDN